MMARLIAVLLSSVLMVAMAACSSSGSRSATSPTGAPSAATAAPADVNGVWSGALVGGAPVTMNLRQSGTSVTGDLSVGGRADISGPVEGTVDGSTIRLRERTGYGSAPLLRVQGDRITGIVAGTTLDLRRTTR
jgi:hypothetical protein